MERCTKCALHKTCNQQVWAENLSGKKYPRIMVVGEAPGKEEDASGLPFVGRAGQGLRDILGQLDLLEHCVLTSTVRCRPPSNRTPKLDEVRRCRTHLDEEIARYRPRFIVLCGATSIHGFDDQRKRPSVSEYRNRKSWKHGDADIICTFHPAAALRDPRKWRQIAEDFDRINSREFLAPEEPVVTVVESVSSTLRFSKALSFDLETQGLNPWDPSAQVLCVAWTDHESGAWVSRDLAGFVGALQRSPATLRLVGHNLKFDLTWLRTKYGYEHRGPIWDTMIAGHLLNEEAPANTLKYHVHQETGFGDYSAGVDGFLSWNCTRWGEEEIEGVTYLSKHRKQPNGKWQKKLLDLDTLLEYCGWDACAVWKLRGVMEPRLKAEGLDKLAMAEMDVLKAVLRMETEGIEVDPGELRNLTRRLKRRVEALRGALEEQLRELCGREVNPASHAQITEVVFSQLGLPSEKKSKSTGKPALDKDVLDWLIEKSQSPTDEERAMLVNLREWRLLSKMLSTYAKNYAEMMDSNNRLHATYLPTTVTGRFKCKQPNLQNVPREDALGIKRVFVGGIGKSFISADYSQIELRVGAFLTRDEAMLATLRAGEDLHERTAQALFGAIYDREKHRHIAKTINFGIFYGAGPERVAAEAKISAKAARVLVGDWFRAYPGVRTWLDGQRDLLLEQGWVGDWFGRRRRLPVFVTPKGPAYQHMIRQACNAPIQATASQITKLAMVRLSEAGLTLVGQVHDSIMVVCPVSQEEKVSSLIRRLMENATGLVRSFGFKGTIDVPTPVDIKTGERWG